MDSRKKVIVGVRGKKKRLYKKMITKMEEVREAPNPPTQAVPTIDRTRRSEDIDSDLKIMLRRKRVEVKSRAEVYRNIYPLGV